jgi:formylmethanofuran dehydrogenase subunit E
MGGTVELSELLALSASRHAHLCPRQVLGVRMGMLAGRVFHLQLPQKDKRLFAFTESDGCGTGGISVATGCWVDRRTLRVVDYGKLAATFVDTETRRAVRIRPHPQCRETASQYAPDQPDAWHSQLAAYQVMPDEQLLVVEEVRLALSLEKIISLPGLLAICERCGEEISNRREVLQEGQVLCRSCAGDPYYTYPEDRAAPASLNEERTESPSGGPIPVVTVVGKSGSGKTTLIEKMVGELSRRGYRVGTLKHHSHAGFDIDKAGKDSWRHAQAGSRHVVIAAPDKIASYRLLEEELSLDEILPEFEGVDIVLVEGYRQSKKPTIQVVRSENGLATVGDPERWIAVATDTPLDLEAPQYDLDDYQGLVDLLERAFLRGEGAGRSLNAYEFRHLYAASGSQGSPPGVRLTEEDHCP